MIDPLRKEDAFSVCGPHILPAKQVLLLRLAVKGSNEGCPEPIAIVRVEFIRESRDDHILSYISQVKVETVSRLKTIKVFGNGLLARRYELG
jgi:hypothetical protein